ncbi:Heterokaryon incompatibility protein 6, OR allele [Pseudocercospora fuligena]|uniref:Heterokaryon incompatibility protein 6, OR allele n=1 Tax=Pseudocercospora fuligena TaxID=685502 RepID=A0A8H6VJ57_9PEZI|nr:Heterokaryon incompatibility protein 6, OR allele [Pseudocercospora fuligena]
MKNIDLQTLSQATRIEDRSKQEINLAQEDQLRDSRPHGLVRHGHIGREEFKYTPLEDASNQIRLLKFRKRGVCEPIAVDISIWNRSETPPYYAISYVWGEKRMRKMSINGCPIDIRQNCFYALWQAQLWHKNDYIWIDCLCIDQQNDQEKSKQVLMMFGIYQAAARVLVCIGPQKEHGEYLAAFAGLFGRLRLPPYQSRSDRVRGIFRTTSHGLASCALEQYEDIHLLHRAVCAVSWLEYWDRLWVVQEMIASDHKLDILYGSNRMTHSYLEDILKHCCGCGRCVGRLNGHFISWIKDHLNESAAGQWSIKEAISIFYLLKCADPRDHIYGVFNLLDTKQNGWEQMKPDYTKSSWELVLEVAPHIDFPSLQLMTRAFEIDCYHSEVMKALHKQRTSRRISQLNEAPLASIYRWTISSSMMSPIIRDATDGSRLTAVLAIRDSSQENHTGIEEFTSRLNFASENAGIDVPHPCLQGLWRGITLVALVPGEAQEGDMLAAVFNAYKFHESFLVLRHISDDDFAIVGQGICVNNSYFLRLNSDVSITLHLTIQEAITLIAQDFNAKLSLRPGRDPYQEEVDRTANLLRVVTRPKLSSGTGATLEWKYRTRRALFTGKTREQVCECDRTSVFEHVKNAAIALVGLSPFEPLLLMNASSRQAQHAPSTIGLSTDTVCTCLPPCVK